MVFNTATVAGAVTPTVMQTLLAHCFDRKARSHKPTAHITYDEGLRLIKRFLVYASHHSVEDLQRFTSQWVPHPAWVLVEDVKISQKYLTRAAEVIQMQLGAQGIKLVGGKTWWQWRRPGNEMEAEWIEMRTHFQRRIRNNRPVNRVMLYIHGGAYYFGSVDEHRYQMQRHARKLKARVFARLTGDTRYRLAPQFPFPCGIQDCLAAYLYLLTIQHPTTIVFAGDSAGGGMILSLLVTLRDQGLPLPAGAILISPWVDLTHSFPSVGEDNPFDYIPPYGFHHRPSPSWPPPTADDIRAMEAVMGKDSASKEYPKLPGENEADAIQGFHVDHHPAPGTRNATAGNGIITNGSTSPAANTIPLPGRELSIMIDGELIEIKDQIQMYAPNELISHPLVSPILQPSLGGLPPLLILTGGGEMLRDEQIYLAHKAANPAKYPPGDAFLDDTTHDRNRNLINEWRPTDVQLQVWDDLCHVATTLSFTRPAKYMYRSVAQFGAWALARAQRSQIEIIDDDEVSVISRSESDAEVPAGQEKGHEAAASGRMRKAWDPLPRFRHHLIRQRVDRHGNTYPLEPESELPGCNLPTSEIGVIKEAPVRKWIAAKRKWDTKYASAKRRIQKKRAMEFAKGFQQYDGEVPPPSALASRRKLGEDLKERKKTLSKGLVFWSLWGSKHDERSIENELEIDKEPDIVIVTSAESAHPRPLYDLTRRGHSRSRSRRRIVTDENQTGADDIDEDTPAAELQKRSAAKRADVEGSKNLDFGSGDPDFPPSVPSPVPSVFVPKPGVNESELKRPKANGIAYPFTLNKESANASMTTLTSVAGVPPVKDIRTEGVQDHGVEAEAADIDAEIAAKKNIEAAKATGETEQKRPKTDGVAYPFTLKNKEGTSASMTTLTGAAGIRPMKDLGYEGAKESGVETNAADTNTATATMDNSEAGKNIERE